VSGVASGGELSRLVLALSLGAGSAETPVLAFDEIDTGIGGTTALAMGEKLASLAADRQVICVTHLPQVAAFADVHIAVTRDGTSAQVRILDGDERLAELTRMLAGLSGSDAGRDHAEELLARATGK
jgi:DNA repair protein RecN (Recombination protein N)